MTVKQLKHQQFHDVGNDAEVVNNDYIILIILSILNWLYTC